MSRPPEYTLRPFADDADRAACIVLQREVWGADFDELVPGSVLKVITEVAGIAAGAFEPDGTLAGFVVGLAGTRHGEPAHWSHMLAVRPELRDHGLGVRLKAYQRRRLLERGVEHVYWTYDPLVARNAHLNLNRLGARVETYVRDFYGVGAGSPLFSGIGTDRFIVDWPIAEPTVERLLPADGAAAGAGEGGGSASGTPAGAQLALDRAALTPEWAAAPTLDPEPPSDEVAPPTAPRVRLEIPPDIHAVKEAEPALGAAWRRATRAAFETCFGAGYRVVGFARTAPGGAGEAGEAARRRCYYLLERSS